VDFEIGDCALVLPMTLGLSGRRNSFSIASAVVPSTREGRCVSRLVIGAGVTSVFSMLTPPTSYWSLQGRRATVSAHAEPLTGEHSR